MTDSYHGPTPPLLRSKAWICAAINQLAFPGLGTIMARRRIGYIQATIMVAGFILTVGFMLWYFTCLFRYQLAEVPDKARFAADWHRYAWAGTWGGACIALAWLWALISTIQILQSSYKPNPPERQTSGH